MERSDVQGNIHEAWDVRVMPDSDLAEQK